MIEPKSPIVFCHGLFGWGDHELGGYPYFFCAELLRKEEADSLPRFIFPSTGPISSLHDQACELFCQLKGTRVNYGGEHSLKFSHAQYSTDYSGKALYPEWDEDHPLDFVAHSMGAPVVRMLQYLLETEFFSAEDGVAYGTSARWIRSITTVAGVHNGSTLTWILGADKNTGLLKKNAVLVRFLARVLERYARLEARNGKLAGIYDLHLGQWGIAAGSSMKESIGNFFKSPAFVESEDWALFDLTPNAMEKWNPVLKEYPGTYYFSYVTRSTFSLFGVLELAIPVYTHWFLIPFSLAMGRYQIDRRWHANDGMCPSFSQTHPHLGRLASMRKFSRKKEIECGVWYVMKKFRKIDHAEIAMLPHLWRTGMGKRIYRAIVRMISDTRKKV